MCIEDDVDARVAQAGHVVPYVQLKVIAKDDAEFVVAAGLRF